MSRKRKITFSSRTKIKRAKFMEPEYCTLELFPQEIYEEIYKYLSPDDLKNLYAVSKTINHQVSSSKLLMRKLTIKLTSLKCDTNRPYLNLKLDGERIRPHDRIRIFRTIEKLNLKYEKLHLHKYILGTNDELEKRINSFENLKTLVIENCIFRSPQNQRVVTSQIQFKPIITLEELRVAQKEETSSERFNLNDLIKRQKKLKSLSLIMRDLSIEVSLPKKVSLPLENVSLIAVHNYSIVIRCYKFLTNCQTITSLELCGKFCPKTIKVILNGMENLKTLKLNVKSGSFLPDKMNEIKPNTTIENFFLNGTNVKLLPLFERLPNLKRLVIGIHFLRDQYWKTISKCMQHLELLQLDRVFVDLYENLKFPSVKILKFRFINDYCYFSQTSGWKIVADAFPNVEHLSVVRMVKGDENPTETYNILKVVVRNWRNMKSLKVGSGFKVRMSRLNYLLRYCKDLKILMIPKDSIIDINDKKKRSREQYEKLSKYIENGLQIIFLEPVPDTELPYFFLSSSHHSGFINLNDLNNDNEN